MLDKYKSNQVTAGRFCREQFAASHDASTYYCLLRSSREFDELITKYHGDGEDSLKKAAARVGLSLPETYEEKELESKAIDPNKTDL
uniref:Protein FMC1 homolog n=1 Tax=Phallusia mammillata TaxID=59560 RepID=A0A6F9DDL4_9ASCI|nr:UPF0562 protein C29E4.12-like [Phallusia mammillata]